MQFVSVTINALHGETVVIYVTDSIADVKAKLEDAFDASISISEYDDNGNLSITASNFPIYSDLNITLTLIFSPSGQFIGMDESDYYSEDGVVLLNCVDDLGNGFDIDFSDYHICTQSTEIIEMIEKDTHDEVFVHRGLIESPVGDWLFTYPEMSEPFTPVSIVLKEYVSKVPYVLYGIDILTAQPDADGIIYYTDNTEIRITEVK